MATEESKNCGICKHAFGRGGRSPRNLPCSHCICTSCADSLIITNSKKCPYCRKTFQGNSSGDLARNKPLLDLLEYVSQLEATNSETANAAGNQGKTFEQWRRGIRRDNSSILAENQVATDTIDTIIEMNSTLEKDLLESNSTITGKIKSKLKRLEEKNQRYVKYFHLVNKKLKAQKATIEARDSLTRKHEENLDSSEDFAATAKTLDESEKFYSKCQKKLNEEKEFISRHEDITGNIKQDVERLKSNIDIIKMTLTQSLTADMENVDIYQGLVEKNENPGNPNDGRYDNQNTCSKESSQAGNELLRSIGASHSSVRSALPSMPINNNSSRATPNPSDQRFQNTRNAMHPHDYGLYFGNQWS